MEYKKPPPQKPPRRAISCDLAPKRSLPSRAKKLLRTPSQLYHFAKDEPLNQEAEYEEDYIVGPEFVVRSREKPLEISLCKKHSIKDCSCRSITVIKVSGERVVVFLDPQTATIAHVLKCLTSKDNEGVAQYLGLAILVQGEFHFHNPLTKLSKIAPKNWKGSPIVQKEGLTTVNFNLYLRFIVYPSLDSGSALGKALRHQLYLQYRHDLIEGRLLVPLFRMRLLASLALQAEFGRVETSDVGYFLLEHFLPQHCLRVNSGAGDPPADLHSVLADLHGNLGSRGVSRTEARLRFIRAAESNSNFCGLHFYQTFSESGQKLWLAANRYGLLVLDSCPSLKALKAASHFPWEAVKKLSGSSRRIAVYQRTETGTAKVRFRFKQTGRSDSVFYLLRRLRKFHDLSSTTGGGDTPDEGMIVTNKLAKRTSFFKSKEPPLLEKSWNEEEMVELQSQNGHSEDNKENIRFTMFGTSSKSWWKRSPKATKLKRSVSCSTPKSLSSLAFHAPKSDSDQTSLSGISIKEDFMDHLIDLSMDKYVDSSRSSPSQMKSSVCSSLPDVNEVQNLKSDTQGQCNVRNLTEKYRFTEDKIKVPETVNMCKISKEFPMKSQIQGEFKLNHKSELDIVSGTALKSVTSQPNSSKISMNEEELLQTRTSESEIPVNSMDNAPEVLITHPTPESHFVSPIMTVVPPSRSPGVRMGTKVPHTLLTKHRNAGVDILPSKPPSTLGGVSPFGAVVVEPLLCPENYVNETVNESLIQRFMTAPTVPGHAERRLSTVTLTKQRGALGFVLGVANDGALYVQAVSPGGPAHEQGGLTPGDRLVGVNGLCVDSLTYAQTVERIKNAKDRVELLVSQPINSLSKGDESRGVTTSDRLSGTEKYGPSRVGQKFVTVISIGQESDVGPTISTEALAKESLSCPFPQL